ncbi:hypothetical protein ACP4OV_010401 [Aristida adscensionis]
MAAAGGGERRWQDHAEPDLRPRVRQHLVQKFSEICELQNAPSQKLQTLAANFEESVFRTAKCKIDYMRKISCKMISLDQKRSQVLQAAADRQQQHMQMVRNMQLINTVQAVQGGNSSVVATQTMSTMGSSVRPPSQLQNNHMACAFLPNMQIKVKQEPSDMMAMLDETFKSQPTTVSPVARGIQPNQRAAQSVAIRSQNQCQPMQQMPTNFAWCQPSSRAQLQGDPVVRPSTQQNPTFRQNTSGICEQHWQPAKLMTNNQQGLGANQQKMQMQRYQMLGANVTNMNTGYHEGLNNQQNPGWASGLQSPLKACGQEELKKTHLESQLIAPTHQKITINQQNNLHRLGPQTSGSAGEVDCREEIFQQIKSWKDAYLSELIELNQTLVVPKQTEEQLKSLPKDKADSYSRKSAIKNTIGVVLKFLQLQKSEISETMRGQLHKCQSTIHKLLDFHAKLKSRNQGTIVGHESQNCHVQSQTINLTGDSSQFTSGKSNQQKHPEQSADASISHVRQNIVITTPMRQNNVPSTLPTRQKPSSNPHTVASPCISINSPGELLSPQTNDSEACCTPFPIANSGVEQVVSPTLQSPTAKPGNIADSSPCASVKSTKTPTIKNSGGLAVASPCSSVKSTLPSNVAKSGVVPVASPSDSVKSIPSKGGHSLPDHNAAAAEANYCHLVSPTKLTAPTSPGQAQTAAGEANDPADPLTAKKPIDRLLDALRSSSPAMIHSSVSSMELALSAMDSVPLPPWIRSNNKMKQVFDVTTSRSESSLVGSLDGSSVTIESDASDSASSGERRAKRRKTQNAKDALLDEILAINGTLIDTVISIVGDDVTESITLCNGGTLIKISYSAVSLVPSLRSHFATPEIQPLVMPVKLLVPADYPRSSPVLVDDGGCDQLRTKFSSISDAVAASFKRVLRCLREPRSVTEMARAWDDCVRAAVTEYASRHGGGTTSSRLGPWESCVV